MSSIDTCFPNLTVSYAVTYTRSGHRGRGIYKTLLGSCSTCFMVNFAFKICWSGSFTHRDPLRQSSGQDQVKRGKLIPLSDAEFYDEFNGGLSFTLSVLDLPNISLKC